VTVAGVGGETLRAVRGFCEKWATQGYCPTPWDIGQELGISESAAGARMRRLRDDGFLAYAPARTRRFGDAASPHALTEKGRQAITEPAPFEE
jgi:hypothetical protein